MAGISQGDQMSKLAAGRIGRSLIRTTLLSLLVTAPAAAQAPGKSWGMRVLNQFTSAASVTPSDSSALPRSPTKGLFVGGSAACAITMTLTDDSGSVAWSNIQPGAVLAVEVNKIFATGTTCTNIVALY